MSLQRIVSYRFINSETSFVVQIAFLVSSLAIHSQSVHPQAFSIKLKYKNDSSKENSINSKEMNFKKKKTKQEGI